MEKEGLDIINPNSSRISRRISSANNIKDINQYKREVQNRARDIEESKIYREKRNIKNKPSKNKWKTRVAIGLMAGLLAVGAAACQRDDRKDVINEPIGNSSTSIQSKEDEVKEKIEEAEQDFLERYVTAYNEKYNMDYKVEDAEILANYLASGYVYKVNDKIVTPGSHPDITKEELSKLGDVEVEDGYERVMQIVVNTSEDELEILLTLDADTLKTMYSGNQLDDIKNNKRMLELIETAINEDMGKAMSGLVFGNGNESLESLEQWVDNYYEAAKVRDAKYRGDTAKKADEGYEIGD